MNQLPFPSNENWHSNTPAISAETKEKSDKPWQRLNAGDSMPMMFKIALSDGQLYWYPYSDLREVRLRDAGFVQLLIYGIEKYTISIEGRHLTELATLLGMGRIKSLEESAHRSFSDPEEMPGIDKITVETSPFPNPV